jgi:hypothetical protein
MDRKHYFVFFLVILMIFGCTSKGVNTINVFPVHIISDGNDTQASVKSNQSVQQILSENGIILSNLDRVEPPTYSNLTKPTTIRVIRVTEKYQTVQSVIPFERKTIQIESLADGQALLIQSGENGILQTTHRIVSEDGVEISKTVFTQNIIQNQIPEITMIGIQAISNPVNIKGKIAYLIAGNAWLMEGTTGNRRPLIATGDLDGYIFSLSPDGEWLLFSRRSESIDQNINSLWLINTREGGKKPIDLEIANVVRSAQWIPEHGLMFSFTTVEPKNSALKWQANNDLWIVSLFNDGTPYKKEKILDINSGGLYGWWGIQYSWSPDGRILAYSLPDQIGLVDLTEKKLIQLLSILPFDTHINWAWLPSLAWSMDNLLLYFVNHDSDADDSNPESSTMFNLCALVIKTQKFINLVDNVGMFALPNAQNKSSNATSSIIFFQAIFPDQSSSSRYKLTIMNQDGSNKKVIFPQEGMEGIDPSQISWFPEVPNQTDQRIAVLYQGNLWFVNIIDGSMVQITGDGLISLFDWK